MPVYRNERIRNYTVMSNDHLRSHDLSLKAKGLLSLILSLPDDWNYSTSGLAAITKEGKDCICTVLKELETAGYIRRKRIRDDIGRIVDIEYHIYETPTPRGNQQAAPPEPDIPEQNISILDSPCRDFSDADSSYPENPPQINTKE